MAYIEKRSDNSYRITVYGSAGADGKLKRKTMTFHPKEKAPTKIKNEVNTAAMDFERKVKEGKLLDGEHMTFQEFSSFWLESYASKNVSPYQYTMYEKMLAQRICPEIGRLTLAGIKPLHLMELYASMEKAGSSQNTIRKYHSLIRNILNAAYRWELISDSPCNRVSLAPQKEKYKYKIWTPEQVQLFLRALDGKYSLHYNERIRADGSGKDYVVSSYDVEKSVSPMFVALYYVMIYSSIRRGEAAALTWQDVDFKKKEISISKAVSKDYNQQYIIKSPKTASGFRKISLPDIVFAKLRAWRVAEMELMLQLGSKWEGFPRKDFDKNCVFIQQTNGKMIYADTIGLKFREILAWYNEQAPEEEQLPHIRLHDLRHTGASLMIANNIDVVTVSHRLGHAKPSTTMDIYSHALPTKDRAASDMLENILLPNAASR